MKKDIAFLSDGLTLQGTVFFPSPDAKYPGVLFIHGGGKYTENIYISWQTFLSEHGIASMSYYCRGVGKSEGIFEESSLANRLKDSIAAFHAFTASGIVDPLRICVSGSSMGAHTAVEMAAKIPTIKALILQSAAAYGTDAEDVPLNAQFTQIISRPDDWKKSRIFPLLLKFDKPVFIVYAQHDTVIPQGVKDAFRLSAKNAQYHELPGATHRLLRPITPTEESARDRLYALSLDFLRKTF